MSEAIDLTFKYGEDGHDGKGWYYWETEYPEEGSVGAFWHEEAARSHAKAHYGEFIA